MINFNDILGKYVDMHKVRAEARSILGPELFSRELILALAIRELAAKFELEMQELKDQLPTKSQAQDG
jgi:hypothetical protein